MNFSAEDLMLLRAQARLILGLVAIAWVIHLLNMASGQAFNRAFGLRARTPWGLIGIPCSPLLHVNNNHIAANTQAFIILGWLVAMQGIHLFYVVTIFTAVMGGLLKWLFGNPINTVGASGVIFGYMGFLIIYGITAGDFIALIAAIVTFVRYSANIVGNRYVSSGMLPAIGPGISWDGHLYGFIAGVLTAYLLSILKLSH